MTGALFYRTQPVRDVNLPWFVPECLFPDVYYPDYMSGTAYVMTKNIIKPLIKTLEEYSGPVFHIDDAFITGVLAEKAGIKRYQNDKGTVRGPIGSVPGTQILSKLFLCMQYLQKI
jgi:beta-1,3-galactosyltransferase 1